MRAQSSTASRTSRSTRTMSRRSASSASASRSRPTSMCIHDSTIASARRFVGVERAENVEQTTFQISPHHELRMDEQLDRDVLAGQLLSHRVDQKRHVVGDDLDHGVPRPYIECAHPHLWCARWPHPREVEVPFGYRRGLGWAPTGEIVGGDVLVVARLKRLFLFVIAHNASPAARPVWCRRSAHVRITRIRRRHEGFL